MAIDINAEGAWACFHFPIPFYKVACHSMTGFGRCSGDKINFKNDVKSAFNSGTKCHSGQR
jgi:hypothetical protein